MGDKKWFQCLRGGHRFQVDDYDPKRVAERTCPKCGSNSVRPEPAARAAAPPGAPAES
jgi:predicted  nucleic acid-binding Zn-ribbon protein